MARQAGSAYIDFTARTTGVVTGMEQARAATRTAARQMKADIHEAQASIALLGEEVGIKLPRHLRSFVAELPGVAEAMSAAFNGAAIVGLGMIAVEQAKKIYEAFEKVREQPEKTAEAFKKLSDQLQLSNVELETANDKLQNTIDKFRGLPENNLKVQLDDAARSALKLSAALEKVNADILKQAQDADVSWFGRYLGEASTKDVTASVSSTLKQIEDATTDFNAKILAARKKNDKDAADASVDEAKKAIQKKYDDEVDSLQKLLTTAQKEQAKGPQKSMYGPPGTQLAGEDQTQRIKDLQTAIQGLQLASINAADGFEALRLGEIQAGETGLSAADQLKKALDAAAKAQEFRDKQRRTAVKEQEADASELAEQSRQLGTFEQEQQKQLLADMKHDEDERKRLYAERVAAAAEAQKTIRAAATQTYENTAEQEAAAVEAGQETNAQRIANLRAAAALELETVKTTIEAEQALYAGNAKQQEVLGQDMIKAVGEYNKQIAQLNREAMSEGIGGALDDLRRKALDTASMMKDIFTQAINGINEQLVNLMTGKKTDFKGMASGIFSSVAKSGLTMAEGKLLGGLGSKRDGSSPQAALYTISADNVKKTGTDILGAAKGSPDPSTSNNSAGSIASSIFGDIISAFIPHATGGPVMPGRAYLVGERGPEPFFPGVSGTIGTNAAMRSAFGGSTTNHLPVYVDARGSNDPAAVNMAVHRAMRSYAPTIIGASAAYQRDMKRRVPSTSNARRKVHRIPTIFKSANWRFTVSFHWTPVRRTRSVRFARSSSSETLLENSSVSDGFYNSRHGAIPEHPERSSTCRICVYQTQRVQRLRQEDREKWSPPQSSPVK